MRLFVNFHTFHRQFLYFNVFDDCGSRIKKQGCVETVDLPLRRPVRVLAMKTSNIWCYDNEIFIRCATEESNYGDELTKFTRQVSKLYDRKRVREDTIRDFDKNWVHEGQLVVAPWVEINPDDLYRGVVTNVDPEAKIAEISHLG